MRKFLTAATLCLSAMAMPIVGDLAIRQRCFPEPAGDRASTRADGARGDAPSAAGVPAVVADAGRMPQGIATMAAATAAGRGASPARRAPATDSGERIAFAMAADTPDATGSTHDTQGFAFASSLSGAVGLPPARGDSGSDAGAPVMQAQMLAAGNGGGTVANGTDGGTDRDAGAVARSAGAAVLTVALGTPMLDRNGVPLGSAQRTLATPDSGAVAVPETILDDTVSVPDITKFTTGNPPFDSTQAPLALSGADTGGAGAGAGNVPEPGALALVLLGLGLAGLAVRRGGGHRAAA